MRNGGRVQGGWASRGRGNPSRPPRPSAASQFVYDDAASVPVRLKPQPITITAQGSHPLSHGPNGESILRFYPNFLDETEADAAFAELEASLPWAQREDRYGPQPRLTAWFGPYSYSYSRLTLAPSAVELPPLLRSIRERIEALLSGDGASFNSVLCNLYRDHRDSVDWHADDEPQLGANPLIASVSLGQQRLFLLRQRPPPDAADPMDFSLSQEVRCYLPHGSLLIMEGATQADWQHSLPKDYHDKGPRINLTYRTIYPPK